MVEANYSDEILEAAIVSGGTHPSMRPRLLGTHMEIKTCKNLLLANDLTGVVNILLLHLSSGHSDEKQFVREITQATGKQCYAATSGLTIDLNKNPY
jgi:hypothetical protein